jgi:outer membrane receptor protein involved in Fe transport
LPNSSFLKKLTGKPSFDDFFTKKDEFGNFTRQVGAFEPIYIAGYIMDKFAFNDLIFNVGVRVDRFDANQQVLKDRFLLYPARTLGEVSQIGGNEVTHPTSLPSDAVVYVNDINDPTAVSGYRVGSVWYNSLGQEIADPTTIYAASGIAPYLAEGVDPNKPISSEVFRDYKPQINVMPRVAFSFPISDEALFFAHYDVLTKRPTTGNRLDPFDYFYMRNRNEIINNPDLRPEKTIDYELGFQQVLTKKSSLKISGFYREQRDQVTLINTLGAYPVTYRTWGNIDFGTIKGLTLAYDLRKSGNISLRASYTLQFAEGTGSEPSASQGLINSGQPNLRTIFPYSYDQRHQMTLAMDYRYGEGKDYNGPVVGGKQILKNMGANLTANFASGTPYSAQENILPGATITTSSGILDGSVNGSRKPWNFRADLQIDRNIILKFGEEKKKSANLNVYLLVSNLFNTRNILNVYRATGNSNDDGYLNAAEWQNQINSQNDVDSYRYYYAMKMDSPFNYGIPRTIRLGVKLDF